MYKKVILAGIVFSALSFTPIANAALVTQCGPTICYKYDDAQVAVGTYGLPSLNGDALRFLPQNFRAQSDDGAGPVNNSAAFYFDEVWSITGDAIERIMIREFGDYEITNGDFVSDTLTLDANDISVGGTGAASDTEVFSATGDSGGIQLWSIDNTLWINTEFLSDRIDLTVTNDLLADTDAFGESAWIQKKVEIQVVSAVPLPAAAWLMLSGIGVLGTMAKRRKAQNA